MNFDMIRPFEKQILDEIDFVKRFINATNLCVKDKDSSYKLIKKDIKDVLLATGYQFENINNQYIVDVKDGDLTFRLMFDIKGESVLTYIYVLQYEAFLNNGLSNFGFMLNEFDLTNYEINQNFGFNSRGDFSEYVRRMISIFDEFKKEFVIREKPE
jgi:hypothetical protein